MKDKINSPLFWLIIALWTFGRIILSLASLFFISETENLGHLDQLTLFFPSIWVDAIFGILSLIFGYLCILKDRRLIIIFNISNILTTLAQGYLAFSHFYVQYELEIDNLSQAIGKSIWVFFNLFIVFLINKK